MSEQSSFYCEDCDKWIDLRGRAGHTGSKAHVANARARGDGVSSADVAADPLDHIAEAAGVSRGDIYGLASENEELRAKLAAVERERDKYRPFVEIKHFESVADVIAHRGVDQMRLVAEIALAADNKQRTREGRPPLWANRDEYEQLIAETIQAKAAEEMSERRRWTDGVAKGSHTRLRTLKMVSPDGRLVQIPIDVTINNGNGSLADPVVKYQRKGFKVASPVRCKLIDCWEYAAFEDGRYLFGGYCNSAHERFMEGDVLARPDGQMVTVYAAAGL